MSRRGFALIAVLWVVVGAGALAAAALTTARLGSSVSRNRILLLRARWAREACAEILLARYARDGVAVSAGHRRISAAVHGAGRRSTTRIPGSISTWHPLR